MKRHEGERQGVACTTKSFLPRAFSSEHQTIKGGESKTSILVVIKMHAKHFDGLMLAAVMLLEDEIGAVAQPEFAGYFRPL